MFSVEAGAAVKERPMKKKSKIVIKRAGIVVPAICLICLKIGSSPTPAAKLVVSDIGDILSPKQAPQITAPAAHVSGTPAAAATPMRATPIVLTVVKLEPTNELITRQLKSAVAQVPRFNQIQRVNRYRRNRAAVLPDSD